MDVNRKPLRCIGGPFDGQTRTVAPGVERIVATDDVGSRAVYSVYAGYAGLELHFDPASMPAWATHDAPVRIELGTCTFEVWVSTPIAGAPTWTLSDGSGHHVLSQEDVDVATTIQQLEEMVAAWWVRRAGDGARRRS